MGAVEPSGSGRKLVTKSEGWRRRPACHAPTQGCSSLFTQPAPHSLSSRRHPSRATYYPSKFSAQLRSRSDVLDSRPPNACRAGRGGGQAQCRCADCLERDMVGEQVFQVPTPTGKKPHARPAHVTSRHVTIGFFSRGNQRSSPLFQSWAAARASLPRAPSPAPQAAAIIHHRPDGRLGREAPEPALPSSFACSPGRCV